MRRLRPLLPAFVLTVLAALAWFASARFELLSRGAASRLNTFVFGIPGNPSAVSHSGAPWDTIETAVFGLFVGLLAAGLALVVAAPPARRVVRVAAAWLAAVVAGACAGLLLALVTFFGSSAGPVLVGLDLGAWRDGAVWGLVWGWIPALGFVLVEGVGGASRAHDATPSAGPGLVARAVWLGCVGVLAVAVVVGGALTRPAAQDATDAAIAAERAAAAAAEAQAEADAKPEVPESIEAPTGVGDSWCTADSLGYAVVGRDAALGSRVVRLSATNTGTAPCVLSGFPDAAFGDSTDGLLTATVVPGAPAGSATVAAPETVTLAPGAAAVTDLRWRGGAAAGEESARWIHLAAYPGIERSRLPLDTSIGAATTVSVSPWRADDAGPAAR